MKLYRYLIDKDRNEQLIKGFDVVTIKDKTGFEDRYAEILYSESSDKMLYLPVCKDNENMYTEDRIYEGIISRSGWDNELTYRPDTPTRPTLLMHDYVPPASVTFRGQQVHWCATVIINDPFTTAVNEQRIVKKSCVYSNKNIPYNRVVNKTDGTYCDICGARVYRYNQSIRAHRIANENGYSDPRNHYVHLIDHDHDIWTCKSSNFYNIGSCDLQLLERKAIENNEFASVAYPTKYVVVYKEYPLYVLYKDASYMYISELKWNKETEELDLSRKKYALDQVVVI